jgi:hypothetical protein
LTKSLLKQVSSKVSLALESTLLLLSKDRTGAYCFVWKYKQLKLSKEFKVEISFPGSYDTNCI